MIKLNQVEHMPQYCAHCHQKKRPTMKIVIDDFRITICCPCASRFGQELITRAVNLVPNLVLP